jgi:hypothetical protein
MSIGNWRFPVVMRATPTIVTYNPRTGTTNSFAADSLDYAGVDAGPAGQTGVHIGVSGPRSVGTDVFLYVAATASAEL